jgi:itaconate CoA-transferase
MSGLHQPLVGVQVVTLEQAVAAPLCSRHLADLGANVIKIERLDGGDFARSYDDFVDGLSSTFVWLNRNKRSIALDLKSEQGREILLMLLERADIFLCNLSPGALDRIVSKDVLNERCPRLIRCSISGYGPVGAYNNRKAFDLLLQGEAGVTMSTGDKGNPAKPGVSLADLGSGVYALAAALSGLYAREHTGRGVDIDIAMFDVLLDWMSPLLLPYSHAGIEIEPAGLRHATITPYGPFRTRDNKTINIAVQNDSQWQRLCRRVLENETLAADDRLTRNMGRLENREYTESSVATAVSCLDSSVLEERLNSAGIPWGYLRSVPEVAAHPVLRDDTRWINVGLPNDSHVRVIEGPLGAAGSGMPVARVPRLGEHTREVLSELGLEDERIDELIDSATVSADGGV